MVKVMLVDDHALIRDGLRRSIERTEAMTVVGEAATLAEARTVVAHVTPDVVVVDVGLPDGDGLDLVRELRHSSPYLAIVVLTMYGGDGQLLAAKDAGASAFVSKDTPAREVVRVVLQAVQRPTDFAADGLADALSRRDLPGGARLTAREKQVLALLVDGLGIAAISRRLFISESTTKTHVANIYAKLGATNRAQAVMAAIRSGLVSGGRS